MSFTTTQKRVGLNNMNVYAQRAKLGDMVYSAAAGGYPGGDYPGKIYFVNNTTGSASNDGLTWSTAFAQISTAITAWEAVRLALTDVNTRGIIYVQGTITAYTALTALPNYCDIVGIGADPRGNGTGIARITAGDAVDTCDDALGIRGLGLYNLQFTGSGSGYAFDSVTLFRSVIENCAFVNKSTGSMRILTGGAITIRNCQFGSDTVLPATALTVGNSGGNFNQCLVENNVFYGTTTGVNSSAYLCDSTVFRNNTIYGGTTGVLDSSTETNIAGLTFYVGNYISAGSDAMNMTNGATTRAIGNWTIDNTTASIEAATKAEKLTS